MLVQVIDPLDHAPVHGPGDSDVVEHREMLDNLAQPDTAGMRAHRDSEFGREQQVGDVLVDACHAACVDLHDVDRASLEELLEDHPVGDVLAGSDADRAHPPADRGGAEDVVRARRLLDPGRPGVRERAHPRDGSRHVPDLVRVQRDADIVTNDRARHGAAPEVIFQPAADLELDMREALLNGCGAQLGHALVRIPEPAW